MSARAAVLLLCCAACAGRGRPPSAEASAPVRDADLGLAKGSVFEVTSPPAVSPNDSAPGERPVLPRAYLGAPPRVPHAIADFLPITPAQNACVDCHSVKEKEKGQPTPLPASHYTDLRNAPGKPGEQVAGARWVCTACHVSPTGAAPLVENAFRR